MPRRSTAANKRQLDLPFLELALVGKADYLVTGDADLHALMGQFSLPIITAETLGRLG